MITENFPNLKNILPFRYRKPPRHQTNLTKIEPPHQHIIIKITSTEDKERILKSVREKNQNNI
jgi:hypothetical protein